MPCRTGTFAYPHTPSTRVSRKIEASPGTDGSRRCRAGPASSRAHACGVPTRPRRASDLLANCRYRAYSNPVGAMGTAHGSRYTDGRPNNTAVPLVHRLSVHYHCVVSVPHHSRKPSVATVTGTPRKGSAVRTRRSRDRPTSSRLLTCCFLGVHPTRRLDDMMRTMRQP